MKWFRNKSDDQELRLVKKYDYKVSHDFVLEGLTAVGNLHTLVKIEDGIERQFAIIEVVYKAGLKSYDASLVWADDYRFIERGDLYVYPLVKVHRSVSRLLMDKYMDDEGRSSDLAHVVTVDKLVIMVYRKLNKRLPWICYILDEITGEFVRANESDSLEGMRRWVILQYPRTARTVSRWGTEGATVYNVLEHGVKGDGRTECTAGVIKLIREARRGDVIYFPPGHRFYFERAIQYPTDIVVDVNTEQVIVGKGSLPVAARKVE